MQTDVQSRLETAVELAKAAGQHTLKYFQQSDLSVQRKGDNSPVTIADKEAEALVRSGIASAFPDDAVLGEELEDTDGSSGYRWIVDPIDGTKSYICGVPLYSTLIGIEKDNEPLIGVIYVPGTSELVYACRGDVTWYQQGDSEVVRASVSQRSDLASACFITSQVDSFCRRDAFDVYRRIQEACFITRTWGDGYGYLLIATGRAEIMVDPVMNLWDAAAILPVIEGAGGSFTDWNGTATIHGGEGVATTPQLLNEIIAITQGN